MIPERPEFEAANGDLVWMLAGRVNGKGDDHVALEGDYYFPDYDGFTFWEPITSTMTRLRAHAARRAGFGLRVRRDDRAREEDDHDGSEVGAHAGANGVTVAHPVPLE